MIEPPPAHPPAPPAPDVDISGHRPSYQDDNNSNSFSSNLMQHHLNESATLNVTSSHGCFVHRMEDLATHTKRRKPHPFLVSGTHQSLFTVVLRFSSIRRSIAVNLTTRFLSFIGSGCHHRHSDEHQKPFAHDVLRESYSYHGSSLPESIRQIEIMSLGYSDKVRQCPLLDTLLLY